MDFLITSKVICPWDFPVHKGSVCVIFLSQGERSCFVLNVGSNVRFRRGALNICPNVRMFEFCSNVRIFTN
jgi:hypothetical protein